MGLESLIWGDRGEEEGKSSKLPPTGPACIDN